MKKNRQEGRILTTNSSIHTTKERVLRMDPGFFLFFECEGKTFQLHSSETPNPQLQDPKIEFRYRHISVESDYETENLMELIMILCYRLKGQ